MIGQTIYFYSLGLHSYRKQTLVFVSRDDRDFDSLRFYNGELINNWPTGITFRFLRTSNAGLEDFLDGGLHWNLVSNTVYRLCERNMIAGVQFLPVTIIEENTGNEIGRYFVLNVYQQVEALDYTKTTWIRMQTREKDEHPALNILNPVFQKEKLYSIDIFRIKIGLENDTTIYISEKLKSLLEKNQASVGAWFGKINVV